MKYVQFFHMSAGYVPGTIPPVFDEAHKKPIPACGSDSILYADGRWGNRRIADEARRVGQQRGFIGYQVFEGRSLTDSKPISGYWPLPGKQDRTAYSATHGA